MMDAFHYLQLTELATRIQSGELSPMAMTYAQLERISALDGALSSYAVVTADVAIAQAQVAEAEIVAGRYRGPLHGVPIAVKDLFWTKDAPTAAGMAIHQDYRPLEDATVIRRLAEAGAVLLGKLQLTEGAYSDHHPMVTPPKNPWNADYWPGISSSGPGVAIAAGLCFGALASDTGGSIRWPCAANGLTGIKPSWGRISRHGMFELAPSLDHVGPMARSAADCAVLLGAIAGRDPCDPTCRLDPVSNYLADAALGVRGLRIGVDFDWNGDDVDPATQAEVSEAIKVFQALGAAVVPVRFPDVTQAIADWAGNCAIEAAVVHQATFPTRQSEYGPVMASVLETGRAMTGLDYQEILLRRMALRGRTAALLADIDLLLTPVHPFAPLTLDTIRSLGDQPELITSLQRYTCPFNLTGHPTITLPGGVSPAGLPIAFQLVAADLAEPMLIRAGVAFQGATSWHELHPDLSAGAGHGR